MTGKTNARKTPRQLRRGFTLVELLTIIGIIVILLMILFPVISRAIIFAKEIQCRSNLTQMGKGLQNYLADNDSFYPFCYARGPAGVINCWAPRIRRYMGYSNDVFWCPIRDEALIWRDINKNDPDAPSGANFASTYYVDKLGYKKDEMLLDANVIPFSYGWNDWGARPYWGPHNGGLGGDEWANRPVTSSMIASPGAMIAITDKAPTPMHNEWGFNIDPLNPQESVGSPHSEGANVLWADGHASWRPTNELNMPQWWFDPNNQNDPNRMKKRAIAAIWNNNGDYKGRYP